MSVPKLSISLVNTNNKPLLRACLQSLYETEQGVTFETVLVDNVSTDGSSDMVRAEFPQVRLLINDTRKGFAANHNQAIQESQGEHILVLNEDTVIRPGALRAMCDYLDAHPKTGAVGCRLENPDGTLQRSCYRFPSPVRSVAENLLLVAAFPNNRWLDDYRAWPHDRVREVDFVIGAVLMVRRQVIETVGVLDEGYFIYSEESDWCKRIWQGGWSVAFIPDGTIVHYGGQSSVAIKDRQFCEFNRSGLRYMHKHHGALGAAVTRASMIVGAGLRLPLWSAIYVLMPARREKARLTLREWTRLLRWWSGFGPHEGIRELAKASGANSLPQKTAAEH